MRKLVMASIFTALSLVCWQAEAAVGTKAIEDMVHRKMPSTKVSLVRPMPGHPGMYEVFAGGNLFYVADDGSLFIFGVVMDSRTDENLTAKHLAEFKRKDYAGLPESLAIPLFGASKAKGSPALFVSPAQQESFDVVRDVLKHKMPTLVYLVPRTLLNPSEADKASAIWCARDRTRALVAIVHGKALEPSDGSCRAPVRKWRDMSAHLDLEGTPSIMNKDGMVTKIGSEDMQ